MSNRRSKKNQRIGSSRRGPKGLNRNIENDDDDGSQQTPENGDGKNEFHTTSDYHSAQFDYPSSSSIDQQTSALECPPHARTQKDSLLETELPERKRKMGSTRKSAGGFKVESKLDELRTTEELDEYVSQPNISATEEQHSSLRGNKQSSSPSNVSLHAESYGLGGEYQATLTDVVSENVEKDAMHHQEITSHSYEVVNAMVSESDLLREDPVIFNKLKPLSCQETPLASTTGQKRRMGSTRRPLGGENSENVGVQEHLRSMTENERKAEAVDKAKFIISEEMAQMWDDVVRDAPSSHTETSNEPLLAERADLKEPEVSAGTETETINQTVAFPHVNPEKPLPETSTHNGTPLLNKGLDFKFGSHTEDFNKVLENDNQHVPDKRNDTSTFQDCRDVNPAEGKDEFLMQKEELSLNKKTRSLSPRHDAQLLVLNCDESPSLSQHTAQLIEEGNISFDVLASNISHAEHTSTNSPHEKSDAVKESQEIYVEINVCDVASITCDTLTDLECADERGSETNNVFEIMDQCDARDHNVTQIIMESRNNKEDGGTSIETLLHKEPCEVLKELHRGREYSSTISQIQSGPSQDNAGKMLENKEVREDKGETIIIDLTSKSEEMLSFEDLATDIGSHAHQQSLGEEGYDFSENLENVSFDGSVGRSGETEGIEGMGASLLILEVEKPITDVNKVCNNSESNLQIENPDQNRVLTEEKKDTSSDINQETFQVSNNVSAVIDSSPLLHVAIGSEETDTIAEESDISLVIPEYSQDSYKLTFHSETQLNEGDTEIVPVEGDTDLEIQTEIISFYSSTSEAVGTEENSHDSVLIREFDDTVTVERNRTSESDLFQTSSEALKISKNPENEVSSDVNIIPEGSHSEEVQAKSSPVVHKQKIGSTRRPLKGNKGQRKGVKYDNENETLDSECMINVEKETFSLEDEPSLDKSTSQSSKDGAKEQEMKISDNNDVDPAEGSESDLMQSSFSLDSVSEESTAVTISHFTESQTLTKMNKETEKDGDAERVPAEGEAESPSDIQTENKTTELTTSEAERTEENTLDATVIVREVDFTVDTVTEESSMSESDLLQNDTFTDAKLEVLKVSENNDNVSSVTDSGLLVQDNVTKGSRETDTIPDRNDTNIIPEDTQGEAARSKPHPIVHKRKMGSTRRPLKGNKGQRKGVIYDDENEKIDSECMINVEKETFSLEDEPSLDKSTSQSSKDGAKEQEMNISEKNYVGPVESSESDLMQSSFNLDSVFEKSTLVTISHITESQTFRKLNQDSQEKTGDSERLPAEGDTESNSEIETENKTIDLTSEGEGTEGSICEATVIVKEIQVIGDTVTVDSDMITESNFHQNVSSSNAHVEDLKVSENVENTFSGEIDTITEPSDINIIPEGSHSEELQAKSSPVVHKRKMGSTLRGDTGQRKKREYDDENETFSSESMINVEKETFSLEDEPSPDKTTSQSSKDGAKEQEMKICENNDVGPAEGSESDLMQSSFSLDSVSEESTAVTISHFTESQTLTKMNKETEKDGDAERVPAEGEAESISEILTEKKTTDLTTSEAERTEENTLDATVIVREVDFMVDTVTEESSMSESDLLQNDTFTDAKLEVLKVSENNDNVSSVTDSGLLVQDNFTEGSRETDTIPDRNDTNIIPEDTQGEAARSKPHPIVHKRKMGSTRRPLKGNKGQRKGLNYDDENETLDSECMTKVEKETFSLEDEPSLDKSTSQSSKDGAKEQEMEISEKNYVGPVESSESDLMQSSFNLKSVSEESTGVTISHITESQTFRKLNQESQEKTGDAERLPAEGDAESNSEVQTENKTIDLTSEGEGTEGNICEATVIVKEIQVIGDTVTVDSDMITESDFHQNVSSSNAHVEDLKVSENVENTFSGEIDTITEPSDINIIPEGSHSEELQAKSSPVVHKRKMGSTRRPLRGDTGQRKKREYDDENETFSSESMINVEKETFSLEDEPSPDKFTSQSSKDGAKEQEMEISDNNDVGPAEGSESDLMQSSFSLDSVSEESTAVTISHITESQTLTKMNKETENDGDAERVPAEGEAESPSDIQIEKKTTDLTTSEAERTEENTIDATVIVREVDFTVDTVTEESSMSESDLLQNDTFTDAKLEVLKVSENNDNVSSVTDSGLLVQDNVTKGSRETDTIPDRNDTNIIPEDTQGEAARSKPSPVVHKRKMGSTRRPLKGNKGQRKGVKYDDENETLDSECMTNKDKKTFSLEDEPSPDKFTSQSSKDGAKEQEMEISDNNDIGPAEGSESDLMQSSFSLDSVSEESTAVTISHFTESQTPTKRNKETENDEDAERVPAEGEAESPTDIQTEKKTTDLTTSEAERTEENTLDATVIVREVDFTVDTVTEESSMSESDLLQNDTFTDAKLKALKVSENNDNVSSVTDSGLLVQDNVTEGSIETDTIPDRNDINIIPEDTQGEAAHSKPSPVVHKRKMGSTRRPLKGNKGQRKGLNYDDENETLDSECMINVEKETFSLEDEPSLDKSTSQSSKDGAKEQEMEISDNNDVGPAEGSESDLMQSSFSLDSVSEESTAVTISHFTESQTLTKMNKETEKDGDAERVPAEGEAESISEILTEKKTTDLTTSEAERTEENTLDATVIVREVDFTVDTVTEESSMSESDLLQNDTFTDAKLEVLKVSENNDNVSFVTDSGLLVQDNVTEGSRETDTIPDRNDTNIIPEDTQGEAAHSKPHPIVHKRKMGSTRRPLKGNKGQRKGLNYDDENETLDSECMTKVEKETFSLEDEPSLDKSTSQSSKDGAKEQEMEISEKNYVGPVESSESDLMQSSFNLKSVSEESTGVTISHITESQTFRKLNQESQEKTGDAERLPAEGDAESNSEVQTENKTIDLTSEGEGTEGNICEATVIVKEIQVIGDTVTVDSDMITESDFHQNVSSSNAHVEDLKVSENVENTFSGEIDTITEPSDINIIPEGSHSEELQAKSSPVVHKRKMGSTRRPLRGDTGQRKKREYDDENETFSSESMINVEKETFSLEDEPSPDKFTSQSSKDGAKEQEMKISDNNDVGPAEGSESDLMQSSFSLDSVSEESTAVTISHITESQTLTKMNKETENDGDAERVPAEGEAESISDIQIEKKTTDLTTSEAERTEENTLDATVIVREVDFTVDTVTEESSMSESDLLQNDTFTDAKLEVLKVSENNDNVSSVTDSGLLVQDNVTKGSRETDTIPDRNDTNIIPEDTQGEAARSKPSPVVHKRKMGSTRRPLKGNKGQRKGVKYDDENETLDSECMTKVEKETFSLEDEPSPDKFTSQSSKDGAKEQEMEISDNNDIGPAEGSESDLMQSSFSLDSVSEESTAVTISHFTESQTLTKMNEETENDGDTERVPAEGEAESISEILTEKKTTDLTTSEAERTEENTLDATVIVREVDFTVDTVTEESSMSESDLLQNDTFTDAKLEVLKVSENNDNVSSVTDSGLLVQDNVTEGSRETDTIPDRNDTNIIPEDTQGEAAHSKPHPIVHKRKMGSTRRPLKGNKGQRKGLNYDDENETLDSECMTKVEKETFSLEDEPSLDKSTSQSSKDGAKEQEMEISEKNYVGPVESSESDLMQSSFNLDSVFEKSTLVTISHITESQTFRKINQDSQEKTGDAERLPAEGDTESNSEIQTENKTIDLTSEGEGTEGNICEATVIVKEIQVIGDTVTVDSDMITESDFHQNVSSSNVHVEDLKVSENVENTFLGEIDTITEPSDINIIPEGSHSEELQAKSSPVVHKRKMGSTRRPLRGDTGQRKKREYDDENETFSSESMINVEKETFSFEDEPSPDKFTSQSSKDGAKEQEMKISDNNDVGPAEGSESDLMQSSFILDSVSEESTAVTISHFTESQTPTKMNEETKNDGDAERVPAEGEAESPSDIQTEKKTTDLTTSEAERTEENTLDATVIVREVDFTVDTVTEESSMSESDLLQNDTFTDAKLEVLKVSENNDNVSSVTDSGLLVQDNVTEGSRETDTIPDRNDTNIIPEDTQGEAARSKPSPVVHKRKMGSTRRPLKGNKGQRKGVKYDDENETLDSECMTKVEKETFSLEDEPSPDKFTSQSSKDGAMEQEMEISDNNDVGPAEGSESDLMQSSFSLDSVSEESTAVTNSHFTESQTLTKMNKETENDGDAERALTEGEAESISEILTEKKTTDLTTSEAERTEENTLDATVIVREVDFTVDTVTEESSMSESDLLQNDTFTDAKLEVLKVSENNDNVSSVTDSGLLVQVNVTEGSRETDTIPDRNDTNIIPKDTQGEAAHSKPSPVVHKRKMGSTRRPLKGNKGQRKGLNYDDENETLDSECMTKVEKETFSLDEEPSPDKTTSQSSKYSQKLTDVKLDSEYVSFVTDTGLLVQDDATETCSNVTTESDFHQNAFSQVEELKLSEHFENKVSGERYTITEPSDINIIPEGSHSEEVQAKSSPVVHKRKMGSTRRPLRGNKGQRKGQEDTETLSEIQDQNNVVGYNMTQEICNIRHDENEERMTTTLVGMSVLLCDDLKQEHTSDVSQTQTDPSQIDTDLLEVPVRTADLVRDSLTSHYDLVLSDSLSLEETQIHVSSEDFAMGDTWVPPTEVVEVHSVSNRSLQKRKIGSTRKRGKRMVNEEEVEEEKEGEAENTTIDDGTTQSEKTLILGEAITGSLVHLQAFQQSDVQTEKSEQNDQNQDAEIVSDLPLGDVETYSFPEQSEIISLIPEESHRKDVQSNSIPVVHKRKMGSSRKTLKGNKGQRREVEPKKMDGESKGIAKEQDTGTQLSISEGENDCKLDEDVEQNFPVEFSHQAAISNMLFESEDGVKEFSLINTSPEVSEEKGLENTVNDSNSLNEAINLYEGTRDTFVLTVSHEDVHQTMSAEFLDQHVHGGSETEQTETMCHVFSTQEQKNTQDYVNNENSSQNILCTKEKKRKMGSTRRNPQGRHGKDMGDQDDILGMAMERETKKAEDDLDDMPLASIISEPKEMSSEAVSATDLELEMSVSATDLKGGENDYQNNSDSSGPSGPEQPENTLQIWENQLVSADVTKQLQPENVTVEKRRKIGSTRKNVREGGIRGKRDAYKDTETADTHLMMSQDSEIILLGKAVGEQKKYDQSEDSLLKEIERALNKTSQSSSNYELNINEPNSGHLENTPYLNKPENPEIKSLQPQPPQTFQTHSEPNSPERRRRKMGSTRRSPRQQLKAEREDTDKEDGAVEENSEGEKQEIKNLERAEVSVVHNIPQNKLNKEHLNVPSAHTSSSQLEESGNPVVQERTSPSTKRKFGSRRTNKGKQGLGRLDAADRSELEDEVNDDLTVCDAYPSLQPENQPISKSISEQSNMEARNEEAAPKGTDAGLVSLDQIIKRDRSTGTKQTINIQNRNNEVQFNVVMVGNSCVGKTSFIRRFHEGQFTEDYRSTIGVDTCMQTVVLPDRTVKLQIWDTAGQERFHSITRQVFHKADAVLLMYEITCSKSFISVRDWISQAQERAPDDAIMILLGNKNDSVKREVQSEEGGDLAREYNMHFMECSAATGANVSESMMTLAELLVQRKTQKKENTILRRESPPKKSGCC